ncbi:MAG: aldo/keto reductase [Candidatus Brocadiaceae bacterium]
MQPLQARAAFGETELEVPPIIFGTSCLGNLYQALPWDTKLGIMREWFRWVEAPVALDSAGKYGAGLALEVIGKGLRELGVTPEQPLISNKLGWLRVPLRTPEPTFEPGAWADLEYDAEQKISFEGILECHEQGCELLGWDYTPQIVSVHDPDEYLAQAASDDEREARFRDVVGAYRALGALKAEGRVQAVGVGSKDWRVIRDLADAVELDWVMFACSLTIMHHPPELLAFMSELKAKGIAIINSAVFHAGFLTGGKFFDYREVSPDDAADRELFAWRDRFFAVCERFDVVPAEACVQFGMSAPGVVSIALNTSKPARVRQNVAAVQAEIPGEFWAAMKEDGLVAQDYPYVG